MDPELRKMVQRQAGPSRWPWLLALGFLALVLTGLFFYINDENIPPEGQAPAASAPGKAPPSSAGQALAPPPPSALGPEVTVAPAEGQGAPSPQAQEQAKRKEPYGLSTSLDAVARSDESLRIAGQKVPVRDLERKLVVEQRQGLLEKSLEPGQEVTAWGVHLVRPGESLWSIHYAILREYLASRGVRLPPRADQPTPQGHSSGVGRVLKFAENMVGVYNVKSGRMSRDLNQLEPGDKAVIFNLSEIFAQLGRMEPQDIEGVLYDGRVLLLPKSGLQAAPAIDAQSNPPR